MIKIFFKDSASMSEVPDKSIQLILFQVATRIFHGKDITHGTVWRVSDFGYALGIIKESIRVLKKDGFFVLHVGALPYMQSSKICLDFMALGTGLVPILDFHVVYPESEKIRQTFLHNLVEHFFIFSETNKDIDMDHSISVATSRFNLGRGVGDSFGWYSLFHEDVVSYLIKHLSKQGDWVLDPCAGSGVFGKVADALNRNCYLYEINAGLYPLMEKTLIGHNTEFHKK